MQLKDFFKANLESLVTKFYKFPGISAAALISRKGAVCFCSLYLFLTLQKYAFSLGFFLERG